MRQWCSGLARGARTKAFTSDALLGVAAVGAGITLYLALDSGSETREHAKLQFSPTSVELTQQF